jgi:hypothetical protein
MSKTKSDDGSYTIRWSSAKPSCGWLILDIASLMETVKIDLDNAFQTIGGNIYQQTFGCPIGGNLSAIYANVLCAYDEFSALKALRNDSKLVAGIRQVDDLLLFIAYKRHDERSRIRKDEIRELFLRKEGVYRGGLELEIQPCLERSHDCTTFKFAGTIVSVFHSKAPTCHPFLKNERKLFDKGTLEFSRFIETTSFVPPPYKRS